MNIFFVILALFIACDAFGQTAAPVRAWTGNFGAGLALTNGNTDTKNFNLSLGLVRDPKTKSVFRANALYLRGDKDGLLIVDRGTVTVREELNLSPRFFVFGQADYLKDTFKEIRYLISPTVGVGYKLVNTDRTLLALDTGVGGIWEKDRGRPTSKSGAYNASQRFSWKISKTATVTQSLASLWKTNDWADSLHNLAVGIAASVTAHSELKLEMLDSYKRRPTSAALKKNDTAVVTAFVVKF